jgi:hypothetical protein
MTEQPRDPEPRAGSGSVRDTVELLVTAVNSLPAADRDKVYAWLLHRAALPAGAWPLEPTRAAFAELTSAELTRTMLRYRAPGMAQTFRAGVASGQQMVPVRFSSEQHAQLREWCAEHGFSMATVIRGLVARFLEGQLPDSGPPAEPGRRQDPRQPGDRG